MLSSHALIFILPHPSMPQTTTPMKRGLKHAVGAIRILNIIEYSVGSNINLTDKVIKLCSLYTFSHALLKHAVTTLNTFIEITSTSGF